MSSLVWPATRFKKHGMIGLSEYRIWTAMRYRCRNKNHMHYASYGGRGIRVCERWDSFQLFFDDVGPRPARGYTLDRINNDGDYEPGNVRWATAIEQHSNTRANRILEHDGKRMTVAAWAREIGVNYSTLHERLRRGFSPAEALSKTHRRQAESPASPTKDPTNG